MAKSKKEQDIERALTQQINAENKYYKNDKLEALLPSKNQNAPSGNPIKFKTLVIILVALLVALFLIVLTITAIQYFVK